MLGTYYCWRPVSDGYECLQLLEQNGGFGNNGAQPPMQIHNVHNNAGKAGFYLFLDDSAALSELKCLPQQSIGVVEFVILFTSGIEQVVCLLSHL